jgi:hypothetical protein
MKITKHFALTILAASTLMTAGSGMVAPASQANSCTLPDMATNERPDPDGVPTLVTVGLDLVDLTRIDAIDQQMTVDFLVRQSWRDKRLEELAGCKAPLAGIWSPGLDFVNSGRAWLGLREEVRIEADGRVVYIQRHRGSLSFPHRLERFPFDRQTVRISMVAVSAHEGEVKLLIDQDFTKRSDQLLIPDWSVGMASASVGQLMVSPADPTHSRFDFQVEVERRADYYVWKVVVPLVLIVAMSWSVFWLNPARFGPQIGLSATSMLTLIAFQFAMVGILPRLSYFTVLDRFIAASTVLVFLALLETLTTAYLVSIEKNELAHRLDKVCRWLFPLTFVILFTIVFWT